MGPSQKNMDAILKEIDQEIKDRVNRRHLQGGNTPQEEKIYPSNSIPIIDLSRIRNELAATHDLCNRVGEINPRPPGPINSAIQLVKRIIRRMLSWYSRPIAALQGNVTRILEETAQVLEQTGIYLQELHEQNQEVVQRLEALQAHLEQALAAEREQAAQRWQALQQQLAEAQTTYQSELTGLNEHLNQCEQALAVERTQSTQRWEALQQQLAETHAAASTQDQRLTQIEQSTPTRLEALQREFIQQIEAAQHSQSTNINDIRAQLGTILAQIGQLQQQAETVGAQVRKYEQNRIFERIRLSERNVRRLTHLLEEKRQDLAPATQPQLLSAVASEKSPTGEFDYFWFQERYRGDEALIKERQRGYVEYFRECQNVLDLGCGRGEFLELMGESGVPARGVEINTDMFLLCKEKGLDVIQEDIFSYLHSVPDESVGGIYCGMVIEHLSVPQLTFLLWQAYRKLRHGGPLVIETINPECLFVYARALALDPDHVRPYHAWTMELILESMGYHNISVKYSSPVDEHYRIPLLPPALASDEQLQRFNQSIEKLNELLYGYQDYAVIAYR